MSDENTPDDIAGIFDNLTPDMFVPLATSAVDELAGDFAGAEAFDEGVESQIRGVRTTFINSFGVMNPIATLSNASTQRAFIPTSEETVQDFLTRLHNEAVAMEATWFFFARLNPYRLWHGPEEQSKDTDFTSTEVEAPEDAEQGKCVLWYAERREPKGNERRQGILVIEDGRLTRRVDTGDQPSAILSLVLGTNSHHA